MKSEELDLDTLRAEFSLVTELDELTSGFAEIRRDVEGYLRVKGLNLKEFINKVQNYGGDD